jgi:hypothetical protein
MKNLPYLTRICRALTSVLITITVAGCATAAPLDDAALIEVKLATADDLTRYAQAREICSRAEFAGASFSDGKGHVLASFSPSEYDLYLAYVREHPDPLPIVHAADVEPKQWPVVRVAFKSSRVLFDPDASSIPSARFFLCGSNDEKGLLGMRDVVWRDRFVTPERARQIEKSLKDEARPQTYEIFFDYEYWDRGQPRQQGRSVTLLPLPDDLCVALHQWNYPLPSSVGRPLRISKDVINAAIGPLPRQLSDSEHHER